MNKKFLIPVVVLAIGSLVWWAYSKQKQESLTVSGTVQAYEVDFGPRQGGRVAEVYAKEGQLLKKGQAILSLEADELKAQKDAIVASIEAQKAYIQELEVGTRPDQTIAAKNNFEKARADYELTLKGNRQEDIESAKAEMESAQSDKERAAQNVKRKEALFKQQLISNDQLEDAQNKFTVAQKRYEEARQNSQKITKGFRKEEIQKNYFNMRSQEATFKDLEKGTRPEKLAAERSRLKNYQAQQAEIESRLKELQVSSPCDCELGEFEIEPGTLVLANQVLGTLINYNDIWVDAYFPEEYYGRIWPGDKVIVSSLAYPGRKFQGKVKFVNSKAEFTPRNIQTIEGRKQEVFKVKVALDNSQKLFRPGMDIDMNLKFVKRGAPNEKPL